MEKGLLDLHSVLRWVILLFLVICLFQAMTKQRGLAKTSLILMICSHLMLVVGLYQVIAGRYGIMKGLPEGVELMKNSFYRFFWVEHPLMMIIAIILITIARRRAKVYNYRSAGILLFVALLLILAAIPWPFREIGRPLFPGM
jgi:uncharacterized membrane protein